MTTDFDTRMRDELIRREYAAGIEQATTLGLQRGLADGLVGQYKRSFLYCLTPETPKGMLSCEAFAARAFDMAFEDQYEETYRTGFCLGAGIEMDKLDWRNKEAFEEAFARGRSDGYQEGEEDGWDFYGEGGWVDKLGGWAQAGGLALEPSRMDSPEHNGYARGYRSGYLKSYQEAYDMGWALPIEDLERWV